MADNKTPLHSFLHSFCLYPEVKFDVQRAGEEVVLVVRAHPITQLPWVINAILLALLLIGLNFLFPLLLNPNQILFLNIAGPIGIFTYIWFNFLNWFFNVGIITNQRILDIDFMLVLYKEVNIANLGNIEQVNSIGAGFFGSLFNYGNVNVETAGAIVNIEFNNIPNPTGAVRVINDLLPTHD